MMHPISTYQSYLFSEEEQADIALPSECWKVLIVDDEPEVHEVTKMVLDGFSYMEKGLNLLSAYSLSDAKTIIEEHNDLSIILLDVVMQNNSSGLELISYVRNEMGQEDVRILLRTGQAGIAPEREIINSYDIDGFLSKSELTFNKLYTAVRCGLKNYRDLQKVKGAQQVINAVEKHAEEELKKGYEALEVMVKDRTRELLEVNSSLQEEIQRRKAAEKELSELVSTLSERVKDLHCMYQITKLFAGGCLTLEATLGIAVGFLPPAWQYPDITCGRIILRGKEYRSCSIYGDDTERKCKESKWKQTADIVASGRKVGFVEVFYLKEKPERDEGPFLKEERSLINAIGNLFGNIIERTEWEELLHQERAKAQHYLDTVESIVLLINQDQKVSLINKKGCKVLGYEESEVLGENWFQKFLKADVREEVSAVFNEVINGDGTLSKYYENSIITKGGVERKIAWHNTVIHDAKGNVEAVLSAGEDITEKKNAEATISALLESMVGYTGQEFFDRISEVLCGWLGSDCTIVGEILDGKKVNALSARLDGKMVQSVSYNLKGSPCEDATKKGYCSFLKGVQERFPDDLDLISLQAEGYVGIPLKDKNSHLIGVLCSLSHKPLNLPPRTEELFKILGAKAALEIERSRGEKELLDVNKNLKSQVAIEVDERMKQQHLLEHQSKMAAMGEMLSAIAHQWRQPLNVIGLHVQSLQFDYDENSLDRERIEWVIDATMTQLEYMSHTIDDFKDFFKSSKVKSPFRIIDAVNETLSLVQDVMKENMISIEIIADERGQETVVLAFKNELKQVLLNIVNNAKDSILEKQRRFPDLLSFQGTVAIRLSEASGQSILEIIDNGIGIPQNVIEKIFDPYFSTKEDSRDAGTGIGLYMSKRIIEGNLGGELMAQNLDAGAKFTIRIKSLEEGRQG